jgi:hypothetical protein
MIREVGDLFAKLPSRRRQLTDGHMKHARVFSCTASARTWKGESMGGVCADCPEKIEATVSGRENAMFPAARTVLACDPFHS